MSGERRWWFVCAIGRRHSFVVPCDTEREARLQALAFRQSGLVAWWYWQPAGEVTE